MQIGGALFLRSARMKEIQLSQGKIAVVDDEDYEYINQWKWSYLSSGYAVRSLWSLLGSKTILMHRIIANTPIGMDTDHINGNRLDNRKSNLRVCTHAENTRNIPMHKDNKIGYKGVQKHGKSWRARILVNGKQIISIQDTITLYPSLP